MRHYPKMLTAKSNQLINSQVEALAAETGRNRSEYLRDLITVLTHNREVRQAVTRALGTAANSDK